MKNSFCSYYNHSVCQSCQWIELSQEKQLKKKEDLLKTALDFMNEFQLIKSERSPQQDFRNRAKWIVTGTSKSPTIGLTGLECADKGRDLIECPITHPKILKLSAALKSFIQKLNLTPYSIQKRNGELKAFIIFYSPLSNEMYLRFVLRSKKLVQRITKEVPLLQKKFPELTCVSANLQPIPQAILEGPEEVFLSQKQYIRHKILNKEGKGLTFDLTPQAFVQSNYQCAEKLYQCAGDWIAELSIEFFLELYCGQGAFSFFAAPYVNKALGIEINPAAVQSASKTAQKLNYQNLEFIAADVERLSGASFNLHPDLVLINPPRRGLGSTSEWLLKTSPQYILYSSCSWESLAKDLKVLKNQYKIKKAKIFDMFPHTSHFESLILLKKNQEP